MITIEIDRSTIRPNPNAGRTLHKVPGQSSGVLSFRGSCPVANGLSILNDVMKILSEAGIEIFRFSRCRGDLFIDGGFSPYDKELDRIRSAHHDVKKIAGLMVEEFVCGVHTEVQSFRSLTPSPAYLYEYHDRNVVCRECGCSFPHGDLEADYDGYGEDDEVWSNSICPVCGEWDCCDFVFEELSSEMIDELGVGAEESC